MGTGKSSAAITYLNEHPNDRFIYITPYLDEAARIKRECPDAHFIEPSEKLREYQYKKSAHTAALIKEGRNISTTHQAFKGYSAEMLEDIRQQGYTLIIDENVEVLERFDIDEADLQLAIDAGYIKETDGVYSVEKEDYNGRALHDLFYMLKSRELVKVVDKNNTLFYWALPPELILSFKDVFVLTYLFGGQSIHHFLEIYNIPYEFIGIARTDGNQYRFCEAPGYTPEYVSHLSDMIHILDNDRLNAVGDDFYALSMSWFEHGGEDVEQLKRNIMNCYKNIWGDVPLDKRLWGSYKSAFNKLRGKGYTNAFLTFNAKATNNYRNRSHLVYPVNIFMNVEEKKFYHLHGIEVDEDIYALSIMVQWIWRSGIRDGQETYIYIPSRRMRTLLVNWIHSLSKGGCVNG
jgi:hypothetical protein